MSFAAAHTNVSKVSYDRAMGTADMKGRARPMLALPAAAVLVLALAACGGTTSAGSTRDGTTIPPNDEHAIRSPAPAANKTAGATRSADRDGDRDFGSSDVDLPNALGFQGHAATAADRAAVVALVKRFYSAALAEDGAKGCSQLYTPLVEAAPEDYGEPGGPEYTLGAKNCTEVLTDLFRHFHGTLTAEVPKLRVLRVLIERRQGVALIGFGALPKAELPLLREETHWRVGALQDHELP